MDRVYREQQVIAHSSPSPRSHLPFDHRWRRSDLPRIIVDHPCRLIRIPSDLSTDGSNGKSSERGRSSHWLLACAHRRQSTTADRHRVSRRLIETRCHCCIAVWCRDSALQIWSISSSIQQHKWLCSRVACLNAHPSTTSPGPCTRVS